MRRFSFSTLLSLFLGCFSGPGTVVAPPGDLQATHSSPNIAPLLADEPVVPKAYFLYVNINPEQEDFEGKVDIELELSQSVREITLFSRRLKIKSCEVVLENGSQVPLEAKWPTEDEYRLHQAREDELRLSPKVLQEVMPPGKQLLRIEYQGQISSTESAGVFRRKRNDRWEVFTQFEPQMARAAFPSFDSPEFKTPFTLNLIVPKSYNVASNTEVIRAISLPFRKKLVQFRSTQALPTYLLAFTVGHFKALPLGKTLSKKNIQLLLPQGQARTPLFSEKFAARSIHELEKYFALPYPFEKLDLLPIPTFPGAMEHPGLVTFNAPLLLRPENLSSQQELELAAEVIAHEFAHQWFGNLVTMTSWQDLWLNEGFASWLGPKIVERLMPQWQRTQAQFQATTNAFEADKLSTARRIREPITNRGDVTSAFDGITYGKTAAVLGMFEAYVGEEKFRGFLQDYVKSNAFGTLSGAEFLNSFAKFFGSDLSHAFSTFLENRGVPLLDIQSECNQGQATIILTQQRFTALGEKSEPALWSVPYCLQLAWAEQDPMRELQKETRCGLLKQEREALHFDRCPVWISGNANGKGYYLSTFPVGQLQILLGKKFHNFTTLEQLNLLRDLRASLEAGKLSWGEVLQHLPTILQDATDEVVQQSFQLSRIPYDFLGDSLEPHYRGFLASLYSSALKRLIEHKSKSLAKNAGSDISRENLRTSLMISYARDLNDSGLRKKAGQMARAWLEDSKQVDLREKPFMLASGLVGQPATLHQFVRDKIEKEKDPVHRNELIALLRSAKAKDEIEKNFLLLLQPHIPLVETLSLLGQAFQSSKARDAGFNFLKQHLGEFVDRLPEQGRSQLIFMSAPLCSEDSLQKIQELYQPYLEKIPGGQRAMKQTLESIARCLRLKEFHAPGIRSAIISSPPMPSLD